MAPVEPVAVQEDGKKKVRVLVTGFGPFRATLENPSWDCATQVSERLNATRGDVVSCDRAFMPTEYAAVIDRIPALHGVADVPADGWASKAWRTRDTYTKLFANETWHQRNSEDTERLYDLILHIGQGLYDSVAIETVAHRRGCKALDNAGLLPPEQTVISSPPGQAIDGAVAHEQVLSSREASETTNHGYPLRPENDADASFEVLQG